MLLHDTHLINYTFFAGIGGCYMDDMPEIDNGHKEMQRGTRGSVFKYKCNPKFKLFGYDGPISCLGYKQWSTHETPVCTRKYS